MTLSELERRTRNKARMKVRRTEERTVGPTDSAFEHLAMMMEEHAHGNMAPLPVAISLSEGSWIVDIHVRLKNVEYELQGNADTIDKAIRNATARFTGDTFVQDQSYATPFGVRKIDRIAETRSQS